MSRAALYRYEKGEVITLDTVKRLAELLNLSPLTLLGIGVEYYNRPIAYFERLRQSEETADQLLEMLGPFCYLTTSDAYDTLLAEAFEEAAGVALPVGRTGLSIAISAGSSHGVLLSLLSAERFTAQLDPVRRVDDAVEDGIGEGRLDERLGHFSKPKLLIVDELGYLPFEPDAAHLFFQLVSRRYERGSMLITSNRAVVEWGTVFGDAVMAPAILDRLLHHSHVLTIRGDSYRLREKRRSGLLKAGPEAEPQAKRA